MSGYSDYLKDMKDIEHQRFMDKWGPKEPLPTSAITRENLEYQIARANRAESKLLEIRDRWGAFLKVIK